MVSECDALMARLQGLPHHTQGWKELVKLAEASGDISRINQTYGALLKQYPHTAAAQIAYLQHLLHGPTPLAETEAVFSGFLRTSPSVALWTVYLSHVRRMNTGSTAYGIICQAYDYALNHVGQDRDSAGIWAEYIQFLNNADTRTASERQKKVDGLRKVYHRVVQIPLDNVEKLWSDLEAFEISLGKKSLQDVTPAYMKARAALPQLSAHLQGLGFPRDPTKLWLPTLPTFSPQELLLIGRWKAYLRWEEGNPLEIEEKDHATLHSRVQMVYRKAMIRMRYYPEIW